MNEIDVINNRIKALGLMKSYVAKNVNISQVHLSYVLNGRKPLTRELKVRLHAFLGIE